MRYADSSALVKLVLSEAESDALDSHFSAAGGDTLLSSALAWLEVDRAARVSIGGDPEIDELTRQQVNRELEKFELVEVGAPVLSRARLLASRSLKSLDAIHIATALEAGVDEFISYDKRQLAAAAAHGLKTVSPGVQDPNDDGETDESGAADGDPQL